MRLALFAVLLCLGPWGGAAPKPEKKFPGRFLVQESDLAILGPDGTERARIRPYSQIGALSADGRWLACFQTPEKGKDYSELAILPWEGKDERVVVPGIRVTWGMGGELVWSADGSRLYVSLSSVSGHSYHVYDVKAKRLTDVALPLGHWIAGASPDGKRLLTTWRKDDASRCCWVSADGKGEPEFITPEGETAYSPHLSPDGGRILFKTARKLPTGKWSSRLQVMDLKTKKRVTIDDPGETHGYCWSADGSKIAYTWQPTPVKGDEDGERTTWLITCDADGHNSKRVTSRRYKPAQPGLHVVIFFQVLAWR